MTHILFALILMLTLPASAQEKQQQVLQGTWIGSSGPAKVYRGNWSAAVDSATPNSAQGSWILVNDANKILLQGTWSAEKSPRGWRGTWSARIAPDPRTGRAAAGGKVITGTWQAPVKDASLKSFVDMMRRTVTEEVSGSWRSGASQGNWWLKGSGPGR